MKTILLDTNAYTGLLAGRQDVLDMIATAETADVFGMVKSRLKAAGTPLPINDVWIAAHAIGNLLVSEEPETFVASRLTRDAITAFPLPIPIRALYPPLGPWHSTLTLEQCI